MYNKTERKQLETALKRVKKCGGDCKHCEKLHYYSSSQYNPEARNIYFAFGCDLLPEKHFTYISDAPSRLHQDAIETLEFELS